MFKEADVKRNTGKKTKHLILNPQKKDYLKKKKSIQAEYAGDNAT